MADRHKSLRLSTRLRTTRANRLYPLRTRQFGVGIAAETYKTGPKNRDTSMHKELEERSQELHFLGVRLNPSAQYIQNSQEANTEHSSHGQFFSLANFQRRNTWNWNRQNSNILQNGQDCTRKNYVGELDTYSIFVTSIPE